jgi:hypothetical protein
MRIMPPGGPWHIGWSLIHPCAKKENTPKSTAVQVVLRPSVRYPATPGQFDRKKRIP